MEFTLDDLNKIFSESKSKKDLCEKLGIDIIHQNYNKINRILQEYANLIDYDLEYFKKGSDKYREKNYKVQYCKYCGKELDFNHRKNQFCSNSCSASYNNINRKLNDTTKNKISISLMRKKCKRYKRCVICNKDFEVLRLKNNKFSKSKTCSSECHLKYFSQIGKETFRKLNESGKFQGWKSRNISSYAETFWVSVLNNNDITYDREYVVPIDSNRKYFLDFLITIGDIKIDLEIDGKQHQYEDRKIHDEERDSLLKDKGYVVYRISWNEINSDVGKKMMGEKIKEFIDFINKFKGD